MIEHIETRNGVRHVRETQREFRTELGRFVPPTELPVLADALTVGLTQQQIADATGENQPRVSEALAGNNTAAALRIIVHYSAASDAVEEDLYFIPAELDEQAADTMTLREARLLARQLVEPVDCWIPGHLSPMRVFPGGAATTVHEAEARLAEMEKTGDVDC